MFCRASYIVLFLAICFLGVVNLEAQELLTPIRDFCQPGVVNKSPGKGMSVEYGFFPQYPLRSSEASESSQQKLNQHLLVKLKAPLINQQKTKMLVGVRHFRESYQFEEISTEDEWLFENINDKVFKSTRLSLYLTRSFGYKNYFALKAEASYNGDYDGLIDFSKRYRHLFLISVFGMKPRPNVEWGLGLASRFGFRGNTVFPFAVYNQTFNNKWGIESTLPVKIMVRRNFSPKSLLLFGPEFASRFYSVDFLKGNAGPIGRYETRRAEFQLNAAYIQQLIPWFWIEVKGGYVRYLDSEVTGQQALSEVDFNLEQSNGVFSKITLFLSPPKSYYDKKKKKK